MKTAAGCSEAQASLEVYDSVKHRSPFLKILLLPLVKEAPGVGSFPNTPHQGLSA